jgi:hypothetical protein
MFGLFRRRAKACGEENKTKSDGRQNGQTARRRGGPNVGAPRAWLVNRSNPDHKACARGGCKGDRDREKSEV